MADFVEYDLGNTEEENEPESDDMFDAPAKKPRGANLKYDYVEEAESFDDLKEKAKNAGLKFDKEQGKVNAGAILQAFINAGITSLPTSKQVNNYLNNKKKTLQPWCKWSSNISSDSGSFSSSVFPKSLCYKFQMVTKDNIVLLLSDFQNPDFQ